MQENNLFEKKYIKAQKRVKKIKGFYNHLMVMFVLIPFLILINLKLTPDFHWFWWAIFGNLVGLFFHWLGVFGFNKLGFGKEWEERKIQEYMNNQ